MAIATRFDWTLSAEEEELLFRAAGLTGTTMADFVRSAAVEKAGMLLEPESCLTPS